MARDQTQITSAGVDKLSSTGADIMGDTGDPCCCGSCLACSAVTVTVVFHGLNLLPFSDGFNNITWNDDGTRSFILSYVSSSTSPTGVTTCRYEVEYPGINSVNTRIDGTCASNFFVIAFISFNVATPGGGFFNFDAEAGANGCVGGTCTFCAQDALSISPDQIDFTTCRTGITPATFTGISCTSDGIYSDPTSTADISWS